MTKKLNGTSSNNIMNDESRIIAIDITTTSVEIKKDYIRLVQPSRTNKKC